MVDEMFGATIMRGVDKRPRSLPFSFIYCRSKNLELKPEVLVAFDQSNIDHTCTGRLKLYGDWEYTPRDEDKDRTPREIKRMKTFFENHRVLFCAVWTGLLDEVILQDYFVGDISFEKMLRSLTFYEKNREALNEIHEVKQLEQFCKDMHLVNFYVTY